MKTFTFRTVILSLSILLSLSQVYADVTKTVDTSGNYSTLKLAFDAINAGTIKTGTITLQIISNTTETASAVLNASGTSSAIYSSVIIYPTGSGYSISANINASLIELKGANNVTLDGRVNHAGTANLNIVNTNTNSSARTILFDNDAVTNTLMYCYLKGACTSSTGGIVYFGTTTGSTGNNNNVIDHCNITNSGSRPANVIYSQGTSGKVNSGNSISNNNIYNTFTTAASSNAIYVGGYSTAWTITGNSFYETTTFIPQEDLYTYNVIKINNTSGNSFDVSDNYIGGSAPQCGGSAFTVNAAKAHSFQCIYLNVGATNASSVQNNIIKNISYTSNSTNPWQGINVNAGAVNIGTITGNTIGATTGTASITVTGQVNNTNVYGIYLAGTVTVNCQNNSIGSFTAANSTASNATNFYGIYKKNTAGTTTINNNTIGSASTANSIQTSSTSTTTDQIVIGIYSAGTGSTSIFNNTIDNISNSGTSSNALYSNNTVGIGTYDGSNTINGNLVHDISAANYTTVAILQQSTTNTTVQTITNKSLYNLSNTNSSSVISVIGISYNGSKSSTNTIGQNFIHSFSVSSSDNTSVMTGIDLISGAVTCSNNIINLGIGITNNLGILGIRENGIAGQSNIVLFNTVYIAGNPSGTTANTYAYYSVTNKGTTDIRNDIFVNARSGGTTGKHYVISIPGIASLNIDYNDYYFTGTGGLLGSIASSDKTNLAAWQAGTSHDVNSLSINSGFTTAGDISAHDYYTSAVLPIAFD